MMIILFLLFFIFTGAAFPKYRAWEDASGNVVIKHYPERARLSGETDDQMMDRLDLLTDMPAPGFLTLEVSDIAALKNIRQDRHKWRLQGGKIKVDPSVPDTPEIAEKKRREAKVASAKAKFIAGQKLTEDEANALRL